MNVYVIQKKTKNKNGEANSFILQIHTAFYFRRLGLCVCF